MSDSAALTEVKANEVVTSAVTTPIAATWASRVSITKDVVGIIKNLAAIVALGAVAVWFIVQRPFSPVIKPTASIKIIPLSDGYKVDALVLFENVGHVPFSYSCEGMKIATDNDKMPAPVCEPNRTTLKPGEQVTVGWVYEDT